MATREPHLSLQRSGVGVTRSFDPVAAMELKLHVFFTKKLSENQTHEIKCVAWNINRNLLCAVGANGMGKVFRLNNIFSEVAISKEHSEKINTPFRSTMSLDGSHNDNTILFARWNEYYQKVATADDVGTIIVWSPAPENTWYEEMVNHRPKSAVADLKWSHDGHKIGIAYEDGLVIVGGIEGNKEWNKELGKPITACAFSADSNNLFIGMNDGEVHAYDAGGNFLIKLPMACIDNVELETALAVSKEQRKDKIVSMEYFVPARTAKDPEPRHAIDALTVSGEGTLPVIVHVEPPEKPFIVRGRNPAHRPRFVVAYQHGVMQLMRNELDAHPIVVRERNTTFVTCRWSPDGSVLSMTVFVNQENQLVLYSPYGEKYQSLPLWGQQSCCFTWKGDGLQLFCGVGTTYFLAFIKPWYKWAYCHHTIIYGFEIADNDNDDDVVVFYETKMNDCHMKTVKGLVSITAHKEYCAVAHRTNELGGPYQIQVCNSIGTPMDHLNTSLEPRFMAMNEEFVVAAQHNCFVLWNFTVPRSSGLDAYRPAQTTEPVDDISSVQCPIQYIDQPRDNARPGTSVQRLEFGGGVRPTDNIRSVCIGTSFFLISRDSGTLHRYNLPSGQLVFRTNLGYVPDKLALNCTGTRLAVITTLNVFRMFEMKETGTQVVPSLEIKDVWDMKWDADKEDSIAVAEKLRIVVLHGNVREDPIPKCGYICSFKDLIVRTVAMDHVMKDPRHFNTKLIQDIQVTALRTAQKLLEQENIAEAVSYIEKHNHPKLWNLLAKVALTRLDFKTAEHAFVKLKDYGGICFLKRLETIQADALRKAEVHVFFGELEVAEKIYLDNDRRDLAIDMHRKMNNWNQILKLLQKANTANTDPLLIEAWRTVGEQLVERQKWTQAVRYFELSRAYNRLVDCYIRLDDFGKMEQLVDQLPDADPVLLRLAEHFAEAGLCKLAVNCFLRCDAPDTALDTCIKLNHWDLAVDLSKQYRLRDVESLLNKYADELTDNNEKTLAVVQLFRKAGKFLRAARLVFEMAKEEATIAPAKRLKKLYVMGALLVEMYREQNKSHAAAMSGGGDAASKTLEGLLQEDQTLSMAEARLIDTAWRGAEAWHFLMLAHRQLFEKQYDAALKTCLVVCEYEEFVDPLEVHCMLALVAAHARQFGICSRAFMRIEALPNLNETDKTQYNNLAMEIFLKHPPYDTRDARVECPHCDAVIPDCSIVCPNNNCNMRFPICIASGKPLLDYQFWLCPSCKHRAYEGEIRTFKFCPLCHFETD